MFMQRSPLAWCRLPTLVDDLGTNQRPRQIVLRDATPQLSKSLSDCKVKDKQPTGYHPDIGGDGDDKSADIDNQYTGFGVVYITTWDACIGEASTLSWAVGTNPSNRGAETIYVQYDGPERD